VRSFIEPDLFDNSVQFVNTTPICLINLLCKLGLGLGYYYTSVNIASIALFLALFCNFKPSLHYKLE